jgi:hypothetical protein
MSEPLPEAIASVDPRAYDRAYNRAYFVPGPPPPLPPLPPLPGLVPVAWRGLDLNPGHVDEAFTAIVERVEGWYGTPPLNGNDTERAMSDGGAWGLKVIGPREVTITGACIGPRRQVADWRDQVAELAAERVPAELAITDPWLGVTLTAMVRAGTGDMSHVFIGGPRGFRYQLTVTAADPLLYDAAWQTARLTTASAAETGRLYDRLYTARLPEDGWVYGRPYPSMSSAYLTNAGNAPAPVLAQYEGHLTASRLSDGRRWILFAELDDQVRALVPTASLEAQAPGGGLRTAWVLAGSRPLLIPPRSVVRWDLYAQGAGSITLAWRSAWL